MVAFAAVPALPLRHALGGAAADMPTTFIRYDGRCRGRDCAIQTSLVCRRQVNLGLLFRHPIFSEVAKNNFENHCVC